MEDEDSDELQAATEALEAAKAAYDKALLSTDITSADIAEAGSGVTAADYRNQITDYQNAIKVQEAKKAPLEAKITPLEAKITELETEKASYNRMIADINTQLSLESSSDSSAQERVNVTKQAVVYAENAMNGKLAVLESAKSERDSIAQQLSDAESTLGSMGEDSASGGDAVAQIEAQIAALKEQLAAAEQRVATAQSDYDMSVLEYNTEVNNYNNAVAILEDRNSSQTAINLKDQKASHELQIYTIDKAIEDIEKEIAAVEKEIAAVDEKITEFETKLTDLESRASKVLGISDHLTAIAEAQAKVDELTAKTIGATITAPISGTISTINVAAGETTSAARPVVVMQPEGQGYTLSFSVTNEQAKKLSVGDKASLVNAWRYNDVEVILASIKVDQNNPSTQKLLTFNVTGSVVAGQSLTVSVGQKSANYDYIVPNSAIREDNNGQFILIVESKSSPLGTRYTATRVDVQVVASDDTQSAITGGVYGYEFVITTATKPVSAGDLVRLAD